VALTTRCLNCGRRTTGSRCPTCTRRHDDWQARRKIANGWQWGELRRRVHERDQACVRCGSHRRLQVHHRMPLRDGGSNELANLELLCHRCHKHQPH
jgi:5-methylcytosine-specific restriction endonuclease McrA